LLFMKASRLILLITGVIILTLGGVGWSYYRSLFPYGKTHRCSLYLATTLWGYADTNNGKFPCSDQPEAIGLSLLVDEEMCTLDVIVGKAGDLGAAESFYKKQGFFKADHTSWHYVEGLSLADEGRALAWDKIPLGHNGQVLARNSREVIMTNGSVISVNQDRWEDFLAKQKELAN